MLAVLASVCGTVQDRGSAPGGSASSALPAIGGTGDEVTVAAVK